MTTNTPYAYAVLESPTRKGEPYLWIVPVCPLCGGEHTHGAGRDPSTVKDFLGHTAAHCGRVDSNGYELVAR